MKRYIARTRKNEATKSIQKFDEPTEWVNPMIVVEKAKWQSENKYIEQAIVKRVLPAANTCKITN